MKRLATKISVVLSTFALAATLLVPVASAGKPKSGQQVTSSPISVSNATGVKANLDSAFTRRLR